MQGNFGKCRSCGKAIVWIRTRNGKNMPCDPAILHYRKAEGGKERIVTTEGDVLSAEIVPSDRKEVWDGMGYISHFATCPNAAAHRRR